MFPAGKYLIGDIASARNPGCDDERSLDEWMVEAMEFAPVLLFSLKNGGLVGSFMIFEEGKVFTGNDHAKESLSLEVCVACVPLDAFIRRAYRLKDKTNPFPFARVYDIPTKFTPIRKDRTTYAFGNVEIQLTKASKGEKVLRRQARIIEEASECEEGEESSKSGTEPSDGEDLGDTTTDESDDEDEL